ncbi:MAG: hypothetical protein ACI9DC_002844 [Gammaproteobacteria bacterium]|jgi:hypothetical protein
MRHPRRINELLGEQGSALSALARGCHRRQVLDDRFNALVDQPIAAHVQVASAENGILTLAADTPVWGHRIRYLAPSVLEQLRCIDASLQEVKIIVRPTRAEPAAPDVPPRQASLSASSASLLSGVANTCENPRLASILRRLSSLGRPVSED